MYSWDWIFVTRDAVQFGWGRRGRLNIHGRSVTSVIIIIIIIIIILIIILVISFMHDIYNYIPETNPVSRVYTVAPVPYLQFVPQVMLFLPWNMFCTFTLTLPAVCVQCPNMAVFLQFLNLVLYYYYYYYYWTVRTVCCTRHPVHDPRSTIAVRTEHLSQRTVFPTRS